MKSVLNIARAELRYMATSPIAWGVGIILVLLFAQSYVKVLGSYIGQLDRGILQDGLTTVMTVYCPAAALMKQPFLMLSKFVLPFLFMNVISREFSSGTIRLIQSSPVSVRNFVWGKFMGLMGYVTVLMFVYGLVIVVLCFSVVAPEISLLAWQLTVLLLYFFFIASICLFASSLSSYALVGGVISILLIIGTNLLNNVGQTTVLGDFFYPLSHQAIGERLITGGIDWNDVIVLLVFTLLFVALTIIHLQNKARSLSVTRRGLRFGFTIVAAFGLIGLLPYAPIGFTDIRREQVASVHPNIQKMLDKLEEGPLEVTHYFNIFFPADMRKPFYVPGGQPETKYSMWRPYMRHKKDIRVNVKYYFAIDTADYYTKQIVRAYEGKSDEEIARIRADAYGYDLDNVMSLEEAQQEVDIMGNEYIGHIIKMSYRDRQAVVVSPGSQLPKDQHLYAAMERLANGHGKELFFVRDGRPREVFYRTEESMCLTNKQMANLEVSWFQVGPLQDSIWLDKDELPADAQALLLLGPTTPLSDTALRRIEQFIDRGGNLVLAGEPQYREFVKPVMDYLGVSMMPGTIVQPAANVRSTRLLGAVTPEARKWSRIVTEIRVREEFFGLSSNDTLNLIFEGASGLDMSRVNDFQATPLVLSRSGQSWNKPVIHNYDSLQLLVDKNPSDQEGSFPLMVLLSREINGKEQRIVVTGDVDYLKGHNVYNSDSRASGLGQGFMLDILTLITNDRLPVDLKRPFLPDKGFRVTMNGVRTQELLLVYALPMLLLVGGGYTIVRRRRK